MLIPNRTRFIASSKRRGHATQLDTNPSPPNLITPDNTVTLQWGFARSPIREFAYSMSTFQGTNPDNAQNAAFLSGIELMNPSLIRYHNDEMTHDTRSTYGWVTNPDQPDCHWDRDKIARSLEVAFEGRVRCLTIPRWPRGLADDEGHLRSGEVETFANWCAELMVIVNRELGFRITHLLLMNELDALYNDRIEELAEIWKIARERIREADPDIKVGGPGFITVWRDRVKRFMEIAHSHMDFVSCHAYAAESPDTTTYKGNWFAASGMNGNALQMRSILNNFSSRIPVWLTEAGPYWENRNIPERTNEVRLIWETILMIATATGDAEMVGSWCESDNWYGLMDNQWGDFKPRPAAYAYHLFNNHCRGEAFPAIGSGSTYQIGNFSITDVLGFATQNGQSRTVVLVNRCEVDRVVKVVHQAWNPPATATIHRVNGVGLTTAQIQTSQLDRLLLPLNSIAVIVFD